MATTTHPATGAARPTVTAPAAWHGSGLATQILVLAGRALRPVFLDAGRLFFSLLQPLVMLLLFSQVFKTVADTPMFPKGVSYIDYLVPAILFTTATTVATDLPDQITTRSPGRAPVRGTRVPRGSVPNAAIDIVTGPGVRSVSPPNSGQA